MVNGTSVFSQDYPLRLPIYIYKKDTPETEEIINIAIEPLVEAVIKERIVKMVAKQPGVEA